jgi:hypothetical protein
MPNKRALFALATSFALAVSVATPAYADDQTDVAKARAAYEAKNYDDADRRLWSMLNPDSGTLKDAALRTQARMYWAATMLARKNPQEAAEQFEKLLLDEPSFEPDPLSFPSEVIDAFIDTRKRIIDKINAAKTEQARMQAERRAREEEEKRRAGERMRLLEKMATEEKITERHSRWVAMLPLGVGQFQNGQKTLGWTFLAAESAFLLGAVIAFPFYVYNRSHAGDFLLSNPDVDPLKSYRERANTASIVNGVFNVAFAVTAVVGIVHAQVTFVPHTDEMKKRPLPQVSEVSPTIAPAQGGGVFGLAGKF